MGDTKISYANKVCNVCVGCSPIKSGCKHCWAEKLHNQRHKAWLEGRWPDAPKQYHKPFSEIQLLPVRLKEPLHWRKPQTIFVNSMSDTFHKDVPFEFIAKMFYMMGLCHWHTFMLFTKRWERAHEFVVKWHDEQNKGYFFNPNFGPYVKYGAEFGENEEILEPHLTWLQNMQLHYDPDWSPNPQCLGDAGYCLPWPLPNVHLYISASTQAEVDEAVQIPIAVRGWSLEPLLGAIQLNLMDDSETDMECLNCGHIGFTDAPIAMCGACGYGEYKDVEVYRGGLNGIIVGCESGPKRRPCKIEWIENIVYQCQEAGVPVYVKQIPIDGKCVTLNEDNRAIWPAWAVQEMPK